MPPSIDRLLEGLRDDFDSGRVSEDETMETIRAGIGKPRALLTLAAGRGRRRPAPWPVEIWISRRRLCERYGETAVRR